MRLFYKSWGLALVRTAAGSPFGTLDRLRTLASRIAHKPRVAIALSFALPIFLRLLAWPVMQIPTPSAHDEFSFLLMADTFAHGRLTNPTHPLWIHFETFHVLQHPTYASIYPVMQGIFLAIGQVAFHCPWLGVMLSVGLMCAAVYWALQAWLPPTWALTGALLAALQVGALTYWMNSYWGGAPAALGGALVLGALPRVLKRARTRDSLLLAAGLGILANSRPYEGSFFCIPIAVVFVAWILGAEKFCRQLGFRPVSLPLPALTVRVIVPLTVALVVIAIFMGYYFWRVTGDPLTMPRVLEARQYSITPLFIWQKLRPAPAYDDARLRYFYTQFEPNDRSQLKRAVQYWRFYLGPALTIPLLMLPCLWRSARARFLLIVIAVTGLGLIIEWWARAHYAAPAAAAGYALVMHGCRYLRCITRRARWQHTGSVILAVGLGIFATQVAIAFKNAIHRYSSPSSTNSMQQRAELERRLEAEGGKHLVLVRYTDHNQTPAIHHEWVYNGADIDNSQIVWARESDEERNRQLLEYFKDRHVWLVNPDEASIVPLR